MNYCSPPVFLLFVRGRRNRQSIAQRTSSSKPVAPWDPHRRLLQLQRQCPRRCQPRRPRRSQPVLQSWRTLVCRPSRLPRPGRHHRPGRQKECRRSRRRHRPRHPRWRPERPRQDRRRRRQPPRQFLRLLSQRLRRRCPRRRRLRPNLHQSRRRKELDRRRRTRLGFSLAFRSGWRRQKQRRKGRPRGGHEVKRRQVRRTSLQALCPGPWPRSGRLPLRRRASRGPVRRGPLSP